MNTNTYADITAVKGHTQAVAFARKGGDVLSKAFHDIADAKEMERRGPIVIMVTLESIFSEAEAAAIPVVGSKQGETGNLPYDKYTATVKTADGERKVPGSWFTDVVKASAEGERIVLRIQQLNDAATPAGAAEAPEDIRKLSFIQRAQEKKRLQERVSNMRTALTKGAMLWHQLEAVNGMNPNRVIAKLPIDADGNVIGNFIRVTDPSDAEQLELYNVGGFLQLDPEKAALDPDKGTIASLKVTAARAPRKAATTGKAVTVPTNANDALTIFNVMATWLDNSTDQGQKSYAQLLTLVSKEGTEGDEAVISVGKVCLALDGIWNVINKRYTMLEERAASAMNTGKKVA